MADLILPTKKLPPKAISPNVTIIFSLPKAGKSSIAAELPNALHLDFERGTLALEVMSMHVKSLNDIYKINKLVRDAKYPYKYVVVDTLSSLEELCLPEAERRYAKSPEGSDWFMADADDNTKLHKDSGKMKYGNILNLGYGKGYRYLQDVFAEVLGVFERMAPKVIMLAHSTTSTHTDKNDKEVTKLDLMMEKKTKFVASFKADAIGYFYRKGDKGYINFSAAGDGGGRFRYLEKEDILISEFIQDEEAGTEKLVTYWDKVYAPKNNKPVTKKVTPKK